MSLARILGLELSSDKTSISSLDEILLEEAFEEFLGSELSSNETIKHGTPTDDELQRLGDEIGEKWEMLGLLLGVGDQKLQEINQVHGELCEKGYYMLKHWKRKEGSAATYEAVCDALKHKLVRRSDLAEKFFHIKGRDDPPGIWSPRKRRWEGAFGEGVVWPPPPLLESSLPPIRSTTEFPGSWSFQISFGPLTESASRPATWTYSDVCKKLYVNLASFCPIKFKTTTPPPPGTYLRAVAVFKGSTNLHDIVKRCPNHMECANGGSAPKNHFIRSNNPAACYHTCPASARHSVLLPYHGPQVGEEWVTEMFAFMCFSSCQSGPSRRPVEVIFTLEKDGHTLGRRVVEIRVCVCPGRDRKSDEEAVYGTWKDPPLRWTRGKRLGAGNFGEVYKCRERYRGNLAVKIVKMEPQYTEKQKDVKALNNEISILKSLKHERIVSYHGSEQTDGHLHLFMDFMPGGSLSDHIKKYGVLSESKSKRFTQQMLEGICFLHSEDIIHRDIKGSNVLLDGDGNVKLADFGLSKMIQKVGSKTDLVSHCGTPHWMAPEIFWGEGYGRKADIWSLGCTVVEMLTGRPPLGHLEPAAAIFRIGSKPTEPTLPESVSQDAKEFIKVALTWKPNERPSSVELQCYTFVLNSIEDQ